TTSIPAAPSIHRVPDRGRHASRPLPTGTWAQYTLDDFTVNATNSLARLAANRIRASLRIGTDAYVPGRATSTSLLVMNSSSTGTPSFVFWMPRLIAATISSGLVTRSP